MSEDAVKLYKKAMVSLQREKLALEKELSSARAIISSAEKRLAEIDAAFRVVVHQLTGEVDLLGKFPRRLN